MALHGTTILHKDQDNQPVQGVLCPLVPQSLSLSGITNRNGTAFTYKVVRILTSVACFIKFGDSTVTAANSDHYMPPNVIEYFYVKNYTYIAAVTSGATGNLYISEMG